MRSLSRNPGRVFTAAVAMSALCAMVHPAWAQGVHVALLPAQQTVAPGSEFDIVLDVTQAGAGFNGFDAVIEYDPAALTFLPKVPASLQQGCLMTGSCSAACGNTFHQFSAAADSLSISDVLLCNQVSLAGPGSLYVLRFRASNTAQVTTLTIRRARFYDAGLYVPAVIEGDADVGIGVNLDVPVAGAGGFAVRAEPNPARGAVRLAIQGARSAAKDVDVLDVAGRTVRRLSREWSGSESSLTWDGRDDAGARVPPGVYLIRVRSGEHVRHARVVLLQ